MESLLAQDYQNIEIILIDDGSTDGSGTICNQLAVKDSRIYHFCQTNCGVSSARNKGISYSKGEYLCFVDSDDYVDDAYIGNFVSGLTSSVDLVFQGINEIHPNGHVVRKIPEAKLYYYEEILDGISDINKLSMFGYVCNKLYKRSIIQDNFLRFDLNVSLSEDRIFALRYMHFVKEMNVVAASSYYYELKSTGLTMKGRSYQELKNAADANLNVALELLKERKSSRFLKDTQRMYVMNSMGYLTMLFLQNTSYSSLQHEICSYKKLYKKWLPNYKPLSTNHRALYFALGLPDFFTIVIMKLYWFVKKIKNGTTVS